MTDQEEPFGPARPDARALPRRVAASLGAMIAALLVPDRGVPPLVAGARYRLAMAIAIGAALLAGAAVSARIDMAPSVLSPMGPPGGGAPPPGGESAPGMGEERTDREIAEETEKQTAIFRVKAMFGAGLGTPAKIVLLAIGLYLLGRYIGGAPSFRRALAAASVAALPWAVGSLMAAAAALRQRSVTPEELPTLVGAGLPLSVDHPLLAHAVARADLFSLWSVVLCVFGLAAAAGIGRARAAIAVIVGYGLVLLLTAGMR